ncbi:MAG: ligase-associated DNA damage response endonuclease PdeM [Azospirillaceae bacterium]
MDHQLSFFGQTLILHHSGAAYLPAQGVLLVADLHLEKGSAFAAKGRHLPPYDTGHTLARLAAVIRHFSPRLIVCLGDSFHDGAAPSRMSPGDRARLAALQAGCRWIWVAGNHDPDPAGEIGGERRPDLTLDGIVLRHEAQAGAEAEISGHYHPKAVIQSRVRRIGGRCFAGDGNRLILPAFGAYAGGLNVLSPAYRRLLARPCLVHLIGRDRLYRFPDSALLPDAREDRPFAAAG